MKTLRLIQALTATCLLGCGIHLHAQTATWTGNGGDGLWNTGANWDTELPPGELTNAVIGSGNTINYNAVMVAPSFGSLTLLGSTLNINNTGFAIGASGNAAGLISSSATTKLFVNNGGALSVPAGGLTFTTNAAGALAPGGTMTLNNTLIVGAGGNSSSGGGAGFFTNNGGALTAGGLTVNANSGNPQSCAAYILGGTNQFGAVSIGRSSAGSGGFVTFGQEGLIISNGIVNMTSLDVGAGLGNSWLTMFVGGGAVTNSGGTIVRQITASRASRLWQAGGHFVSGTVNLRGHTANNSFVFYLVTGGTNIVEGFALGTPGGGDTTGTIRLTNSAKIYIGSGGFTSEGTLNTKLLVLNPNGTFGAQTDWNGTEPILLAGGAFDCADLSGTPHNISISGVLSGTGALTKNGGGTLTLDGVNTYSGNTLINQGTLALGASGSIANSSQIIVGNGTSFDVSAVSGFTLGSARTLGGFGNVAGDVAVASGGTVNPGTNNAPGTLTFNQSLTSTGGVFLHFDLPTTPGPGNDLLAVNGDLNLSSVSTVEVVGGGSPGTIHKLIQYGGNFNGTVANFVLNGTSGVLSNNAVQKSIYLVVQSAIRSPTNVVWVGNATVNDWDTVNRTNWVIPTSGQLTYFVAGDHALFNNNGAANPSVNLVGNNSPATLTVGASANYTFGGSGAISGSTGLTKTNTGTLTITNVNSYTGPTILGGGVVQVSSLSLAGSPSSIGSASADPANLVFDGGTLRYLGPTVSTDRPATINAGGGVIGVASNDTILTISGSLGGAGLLTKTGPGQLTLTPINAYAGGTVLSNGILQVNNNAALGTGGFTNYNSTLRLQGALVLDNVAAFNGVCAIDLNGVGANNAALRGAWFGSGTVNVSFVTQNASQTFTIGGGSGGGGGMWDFSGTVNFGTNSGFLRINNENSTSNFGSSNATFNVGTGTGALNQRNGGTTTYFGALIGGPDTKLSGRGGSGASGTTTYAIGGKNLSTTFEGEINNGSGTTAIAKVGTGKLTLTGTSIYTGATTVEQGTLQVDGTLGTTTVTVSGGVLAGNGTIGGPVTVQIGGTIAPGASVGQLTIINSLQLDSGSTNIMELDQVNSTHDAIAGLTSVSYSGTLRLVINGALTAGNSFVLFPDAGSTSYGGAFEQLVPATPGAGLAWDTSELAVNGTLKVVSSGAAIQTITRSGNNVIFSGGGGPPGTNYYVIFSTNIAAPLATWTRISTNTFPPNGTFSFTNPTSLPRQFFNIQYLSQ